MSVKVTKKTVNEIMDTFVDIEKSLKNRKSVLNKRYDTENTLFIYTRVSTKVQKEEGVSLDVQRQKGEDKGKELGLNTVLFNEGGKSSKHSNFLNRDKIDTLIQLVKKDKVKHLYVYDINRLSRNRDTGYYISSILFKHQVKVYTDSGQYDFGSDTDKFIYELFTSISVLENNRRRKWSMLGKIQSVKMGNWKGGRVNFGYSLRDKKVVVNKIEKKIVGEIFTMFDKGKTTRQIQRYLETQGIISRTGKTRFSLGTIQSMLKNTIYIGYMKIKIGEFNFTYKTDKIIDRDLFNRVQDRMKTTLQRKNQINKTEQFYMLRDFMYCSRCNNIMCGRKVNRKNNKNGENYYYCSSSNYRWKGTGEKKKQCTMKKSVNITKTDVLVWETIIDLFNNSHFLREEFKTENLSIKNVEKKEIKKEITKLNKKVKQIDVELNSMKQSIYELDVQRLSFKIKEDKYNFIKDGLDKEIKIKKDKKRDVLTRLDSFYSRKTWLNWIEKYKNKVTKLNKIKSDEKKREIIENYVDKIYVDYNEKKKEHSLDIHLKMKLFNDKLEYKNIENKSEGYDIIDGDFNKVIQFRRSKNTIEWSKKKGH
tara:strand:+ start:418 stop:2190 length:1773 start_codon:yes stop_codon:yes gene_type:complete